LNTFETLLEANGKLRTAFQNAQRFRGSETAADLIPSLGKSAVHTALVSAD